MLRNLKDAWSWIERVIFRLERLESGAMLGNSSITKGRMRFIGGLLRVDSGGRVEIVGTWRFVGNGAITGDVVAEGKWTQNGSWEFNGPGDIAGDVDITGDLEVLGGGQIKVGNVLITPGSGGKVTVGTGSARVVIDGATGRITAGSITIDPTADGGSVVFTNGSRLFSDDDVTILRSAGELDLHGTDGVVVGGTSLALNTPKITSAPITQAAEGDLEFIQWLGWDSRTGEWKRVPPGMGGPLGGPLEFPFSLSLVTSEFGMRDHPDGTGPRMHEGMDFAPPAGTPIPAAGSGVVASSGYSSGYGNEVWIDHGMIRGQRIRTHYAHMQNPGVAAGTGLGKGAIVGLVGNTGESFGAHLHFEVEVDGVKVNPRDYITE